MTINCCVLDDITYLYGFFRTIDLLRDAYCSRFLLLLAMVIVVIDVVIVTVVVDVVIVVFIVNIYCFYFLELSLD